MTTPDQWRAQGAYFDHAGRQIFYRLAHRDPRQPPQRALVCLHGFPSASWDWHPIWDGLAAEFDLVLAPDLLGFGYSDKPAGHAYRIAEQCDIVEALAASLNIRDCLILAHDYGDTVAQEWLARGIDGSAKVRPLGAVLLNGGLFPEAHRPRLAQHLLASPLGGWVARHMTRERFGRSFAAVFGPATQPDAQTLDHVWALLLHNDGRAALPSLIGYMAERRTHRERWVGALTASPVPLRLINGPADPVSGAHMVRRYRALVADADVIKITDIGHYPQMEAPEMVLELFLRWAREVLPAV